MSKRQGDYSIADILRLTPRWFVEKQTNIETCTVLLKQLHMMLDHGYNALAQEMFLEVFGKWDVSSMEMAEFNKCLTEFVKKSKVSTSLSAGVTKLGLLGHEVLTKNLAYDKEPRRRVLQNLRREQENKQAQAERYELRIRDLYNEIAYARIEMHASLIAAEKYDDDIQEAEAALDVDAKIDKEKLAILRAIPDSWIVVNLNVDDFTLVRRTPLIVNYTNANTGQAKTLNLGFLGVSFAWSLYCKKSFGCADYIDTQRAIHPHLSGGSICWGNRDYAAQKFIEGKEYRKYFELFETLLTTYNPDSPYIKLGTMERMKNTNYRLINTNLLIRPWFTQNRDALVRTWAETASEHFVENITEALTPKKVREVHDPRLKKPLDRALDKLADTRKASVLDTEPELVADADRAFYHFCKIHSIDPDAARSEGYTWNIDPETPDWIRSRFGPARLREDQTIYIGKWASMRDNTFTTDRDSRYFEAVCEACGVSTNGPYRISRPHWYFVRTTPYWALRIARTEGYQIRMSEARNDFEPFPLDQRDIGILERVSLEVPF